MRADEKLVEMMRRAGKYYNPNTLETGEMITNEKAKIGDQEIDQEDYYIAEHLIGKLEKGDMVIAYRMNEEYYAVLEKVVRM